MLAGVVGFAVGCYSVVTDPTAASAAVLLATSGILLFFGVHGERIRSLRIRDAHVVLELIGAAEEAKDRGEDERADLLLSTALDRAARAGKSGDESEWGRGAFAFEHAVLEVIPFPLEIPVQRSDRTYVPDAVATVDGVRVGIEIALAIHSRAPGATLLKRRLGALARPPVPALLIVALDASRAGADFVLAAAGDKGIAADLVVWNPTEDPTGSDIEQTLRRLAKSARRGDAG